MPSLLSIVAKLPMPTELRLSWTRTLIDKAYAKDINIARKAKLSEEVHSLEDQRRFEIAMHDEEEDEYVTKQLLSKARQLRVPVPHRYNQDSKASEHWYQGHYMGGWNLTRHGVTALRDEIRREAKARHELRSQWIVWLSCLTGLTGAITGLVALLMSKS
jgi:hypothetical protein